MNIRVITPPEPFVTPAEIAGDHAGDDSKIAAMIAAATEEIDGYTGWLGRCLGPQELEWSGRICCYLVDLPIGPVLELVGLSTEDAAGTAVPVDPDDYRLRDGRILISAGAAWIGAPVHRVRYWAGYGIRNASDPTKWNEQVPERVKQAIIMSVQHMKALGAENLFLRSEEVEGIGTVQYTVSDQASAIIRDTSRRLLSGLKVRRV